MDYNKQRKPRYDENDRIPKILRELRDRQKRSGEIKDDKDIAEAIGMHPATLSRYFKGMQGLSSDSLAKLAKYFGVTSDYILGLDEPDELDKMINYTGLEKETLALLHEAAQKGYNRLCESMIHDNIRNLKRLMDEGDYKTLDIMQEMAEKVGLFGFVSR